MIKLLNPIWWIKMMIMCIYKPCELLGKFIVFKIKTAMQAKAHAKAMKKELEK